MLNKNQKGFSAGVVLLSVVIVAVVVLAGWKVYDSQSEAVYDNNETAVNQQINTETEEVASGPTKSYTDSTNSYTLNYPEDWVLTTSEFGEGGILEGIGKAVSIGPKGSATSVNVSMYKKADVQEFINEFYGYTEEGPERKPEIEIINGQESYYIKTSSNSYSEEAYMFYRDGVVTSISIRSVQTLDLSDSSNDGAENYNEKDMLPGFRQITQSFKYI